MLVRYKNVPQTTPHVQKERNTKLYFAHPWPSHCVSGSVPGSSVWPLSDSTPATFFTHYCNTYIRAFPRSTANPSTVLCTSSSSRQDLRLQMDLYGSWGKIMCHIKTRSDNYVAQTYSKIRSKHSQMQHNKFYSYSATYDYICKYFSSALHISLQISPYCWYHFC